MANISQVYLLDTPLEDDLKHTLYFANANDQHSYMANNVLKTYVNVSYQRDTSTFRCPAHIDTIRTCNYMMYQNTAYSNKWFYCFIEKMTYVNDNMTDVEFKVDPIQTFMFDFETQPSFIEREHTNDDTIGANVVPENFELGEYVETKQSIDTKFQLSSYYALACTRLCKTFANDQINPLPLVKIANVPDGLLYLGFDSMSDLQKVIKIFNDDGQGDYIHSLFVVPSSCFQNKVHKNLLSVGDVYIYCSYIPAFEDSTSITTQNKLADNYVPRNSKLLTYPYRYLQMSNMNGSVANYKYEDFYELDSGAIDSTPEFELKGYANAGCDAKVYPRKYKGILYNIDEGISYQKLPVGSWLSDVYTNWLTQNGINIATGFISDIAQVGLGVAGASTGVGVATAVVGGATSIANTVGQIYQHSLQPPQAEGATNVGNASYKWYNWVTFKHMSIKSQFARICDDYFDMFGYATHRVKKPNYAHRQNWWYTKTIDCYIKGNIPNEYMNEIKQAYNNGITYWRNPSNFMNYSVSNGIV